MEVGNVDGDGVGGGIVLVVFVEFLVGEIVFELVGVVVEGEVLVEMVFECGGECVDVVVGVDVGVGEVKVEDIFCDVEVGVVGVCGVVCEG